MGAATVEKNIGELEGAEDLSNFQSYPAAFHGGQGEIASLSTGLPLFLRMSSLHCCFLSQSPKAAARSLTVRNARRISAPLGIHGEAAPGGRKNAR